MQGRWSSLLHEGIEVEWCAAVAFGETEAPQAVAAVRAEKQSQRVLGATFPSEMTITLAEVRIVLEAFGGAFQVEDPRRPIRQEAERSNPKLGVLDAQGLTATLSMQYRIPMINLNEYVVAPEILGLVPRDLCAKHVVLPVSRVASSLIVAFADPTNDVATRALEVETGLTIEKVIAPASAIKTVLARYFPVE